MKKFKDSYLDVKHKMSLKIRTYGYLCFILSVKRTESEITAPDFTLVYTERVCVSVYKCKCPDNTVQT